MATTAVGNGILYFAAIGAALTVMFYSRVPWWRSREGRAFMGQAASITVLLVVVSIRNLVGTFASYDELRLGAFGAVALVLWWQLSLVVRGKLTDWNRRRTEHDDVERTD